MFLLKLIVSAMRWLGSVIVQKLCIAGDTPTKKHGNQKRADVRPGSQQDAEPTKKNEQAGSCYRQLRGRHVLGRCVLRQHGKLGEVMDTAVKKYPPKRIRPIRNSVFMGHFQNADNLPLSRKDR
jgi:hypothetical protein